MAQAVLATLAAGGLSVVIRVFLERESRIRPQIPPLYLERLPGRSQVVIATEASLGEFEDDSAGPRQACPACRDPVTPFDESCPACGIMLQG